MATNSVTVIGNLVEDPELRFTPAGVALAKIRVAVNRRWRRPSRRLARRNGFLWWHPVARSGGECCRIAHQGCPGDHHRQPRTATVGNPGG